MFVIKAMVDLEFVNQQLTQKQMDLFLKMQAYDQYHSVFFAKTLLAEVKNAPYDLIVAALLHDVGKSYFRISPLDRTLAVLISKFAPQLVSKASMEHPILWNKMFLVAKNHAQWSAEMAQEAGVSERAISIIASHENYVINEEQEHKKLLKIFVQFDDIT